eukprot:gene9898-20589_t
MAIKIIKSFVYSYRSRLLSAIIGICLMCCSNSSNFDATKSSFSPEGKCLQVDYAGKSVERSALCIGVHCKDGFVLSAFPKSEDDPVVNFRLANERLYVNPVTPQICAAITGISSDCSHILNLLREKAQSHNHGMGTVIPCSRLADHIASYIHDLTMDTGSRPLAVSIILASKGSDEDLIPPGLFHIDCAGYVTACDACASWPPTDDDVQSILEKEDWRSLDVDSAWTLLGSHVRNSTLPARMGCSKMQGMALRGKLRRLDDLTLRENLN